MSENNLVLAALVFYGMSAVQGSTPDKTLDDLIRTFFNKDFDISSDAWCSAFLNSICSLCGAPVSGSPAARSWLNVGITTTTPKLGDIVVFWRESEQSGLGHVGIFIRQDGDQIWTLGGDENYAVGILPFPAARLLGFRSLCIS